MGEGEAISQSLLVHFDASVSPGSEKCNQLAPYAKAWGIRKELIAVGGQTGLQYGTGAAGHTLERPLMWPGGGLSGSQCSQHVWASSSWGALGRRLKVQKALTHIARYFMGVLIIQIPLKWFYYF